MADSNTLPSLMEKHTKPASSSFFATPRLFTSFGISETDCVMSPTSILETKPFFGLRNPFWSESVTPRTPSDPETKRPWDKLDPKGIGLAIVEPSKPPTRMVIFGSQLKIQIPPLPSSIHSPPNSPKSLPENFSKAENSHLGSFSSVSSDTREKKSPFQSANSGLEKMNSTRVFTSCLSVSEMELSEDYTCVISHGPNPKTTHIFDNFIVESSVGVPEFPPGRKSNGSSYLAESFLSFCDNCKKNLGHGKDIFMYRGEKAFCSRECRYQGMLVEEEGVDKMEAQ